MAKEELGKKIQAFTEQNRERIIRFMRDIVAIPSMENQIGPVCNRIAEECNFLGADEVRFDKMGNLVARVGEGPVKVVFDSHVDTVGVGDPAAWKWDPFKGKVENGILFGRGACDEKCSTPGMVYALKALKDLGLGKDFTFYYFGNMEEWCDGLAPNVLVEVEKIRPDFVVVGEPTKMKVYRGHRGRLEIKGVTKGRSCHAANPHLGENAIYKMTKFIQSLEALNPRIKSDPFLGKGTVVVSKIECQTPSINAVPDECTIYIDRRVTFGETKEEVLAQIRSLPGAEVVDVNEMFYDDPSYTGFVFQVDKYFPAWALEEDHPLVAVGQATRKELWGREEATGRWDFSTNATYWAGKAGIPTIGFAPGDEIYAHTTLDQVPLEDVVQATS
ncbi:MAG: YgeY family selenium metabolism-linked hydrolase, partial [bacterium]